MRSAPDFRDDLLGDAERAIVAFTHQMEEDRASLFRWRLRLRIRRASALLLNVLEFEGVSAREAVSGMAPRPRWPDLPVTRQGSSRARRLLVDGYKGYGFGGSREDRSFARFFEYEGSVVRLPSHPRGRFGVTAFDGGLSLCVDLGPCRLVVGEQLAVLRLPCGLPETVLGSCVGRPVRDLVEHPVFGEDDVLVRRLATEAASGCPLLSLTDRIVPTDLVGAAQPFGDDQAADHRVALLHHFDAARYMEAL